MKTLTICCSILLGILLFFTPPGVMAAKKMSDAELRKEIVRLEKQVQALEAENKRKQETYQTLLAEVDAAKQAFSPNSELSHLLQTAAKDTDQLLRQGYFRDSWSEELAPYIKGEMPANLEGIRLIVGYLQQNIQQGGEVRLAPGKIVDKKGVETTAEILTVGNLTAAYQKEGTVGFLLSSEQGDHLFEMEKAPSMSVRRTLKKYMKGKSNTMVVDVSHGVALRQAASSTSLWEQIQKGGPVVWPILLVGVLALIIIVNRFLFLRKTRVHADLVMTQIHREVKTKNWKAAYEVAQAHKLSALGRVLQTGIQFVGSSREDMENGLQEAILNEIPPMEKYLSTLGMLASIAPLLGLLGTVTGMINTFHAITFFGTQDPKVLSGGISEALITTMLGLSIAIPIMVCHTLISRQVETRIAQLEEKAVSLVNTIFSAEIK